VSSGPTRQHTRSLDERIAVVRDRVSIVEVVGRAVKLGNGRNPRGKCPFHGSKSDSFAVYADGGRARCWGCGWGGDAIAFVRDHYGLTFSEAISRLESENGLEGVQAAPVRRERRPVARSTRPMVDSVVLGRELWRRGVRDDDALRTYLRGRGIPADVLTADRFGQLRFVGMGPIAAWAEDRGPDSVPQAPAMVALVRRPIDWAPIGVHVTFLSPDLTTKMVRRRRDNSEYPARKMCGPVGGGGVLLGEYAAGAPLFVGEGIETVLSGMAMLGAPLGAIGLAALSLDNLQGFPQLIGGAIPMHDPRPDPERAAALAFPHDGPVTGLIDADMSPLRGTLDRRTGEHQGVAVIEKKRGPIVRRVLSAADRAGLCAHLFQAAWRGHGCRATAVRPRMGLDFNDAVREETRG